MALLEHVLPRFTPLATCAKCGHDDVSTTYEHDGSHYQCEVARKLGTSRVGGHLLRRCRRCRYSWEEHCVDDDAPVAGAAT